MAASGHAVLVQARIVDCFQLHLKPMGGVVSTYKMLFPFKKNHAVAVLN